MNSKLYVSSKGEIKTYEQWKKWATSFYAGLEDADYSRLPENWFERLERVLKLKEIGV